MYVKTHHDTFLAYDDRGCPEFASRHPEDLFIIPFANMLWGIEDSSIDDVFHEDLIEHLAQLMQWQLLSELLQVSKPGCWHRVNTQNFLTKTHSDFKKALSEVYTRGDYWGHIAVLSPVLLADMARVVGYWDVVFNRRNNGVSPFASNDFRPNSDRDEYVGNMFADLLK